MRQAPHCDDFEAMLDVARTASQGFASPLPDAEVIKTAHSAWECETGGRNWIASGRHRPQATEPVGLIWKAPDAFLLWNVLRHYNAERDRFLVANEMAKIMPLNGWDRERFSRARGVLLELGYIVRIKGANSGQPAEYRWGLCAAADREGTA
jgi:hypothetical protein